MNEGLTKVRPTEFAWFGNVNDFSVPFFGQSDCKYFDHASVFESPLPVVESLFQGIARRAANRHEMQA